MIPSFPAFINEAIQVTGMTSYFLHKSPFSILLALAQHLFPDFFYLCMEMPQRAGHDCVVIRCILLDPSGFPPWLLHPLSFGQKPHPDWCIGSVLWITDSPHSSQPAFGCVLGHSDSPWHNATQLQVSRAAQNESANVTRYFVHDIPFLSASGPCREKNGSLAPPPRLGSMLLLWKG